jgi:hypothetical protein
MLQVLQGFCRPIKKPIKTAPVKRVLTVDFTDQEVPEKSRPAGWRRRDISSFELGELKLNLRQRRAAISGELLTPPQINQLAAPGKTFAYDLSWECYRLRYCENMSRQSIHELLTQQGLKISDAAISHQYWEGAAYLEALHLKQAAAHASRYKQYGFILAIDATNEEGSFKLITARDAITGETLISRKYQSDNAESYSDLMSAVNKYFGTPDAVLSDMCISISKAAATVFPGIAHAICHYHFLRNLGTILQKEKHNALGKKIQRTRILKELLVQQKEIAAELQKNSCQKLASLGGLIYWARDFQKDHQGNGFPFDLKWLCCCQRLQLIRQTLWKIKSDNPKQHGDFFYRKLTQLCRLLDRVADKRMFNGLNKQLCEQQQLLQALRHILRPAADEKDKSELQRQKAALAPVEMKRQLQKFCRDLKKISQDRQLSTVQRQSAEIMIIQINKHRQRLCIEIAHANGLPIHIPRTNNICEHGFRDDKRGARRRCGKARIRREIDNLPPQATLARNFKSEAWKATTFGGNKPFQLFHTIPREEITQALLEMKQQRQSNTAPLPQVKQKDFPTLALKFIKDDIPYPKSA